MKIRRFHTNEILPNFKIFKYNLIHKFNILQKFTIPYNAKFSFRPKNVNKAPKKNTYKKLPPRPYKMAPHIISAHALHQRVKNETIQLFEGSYREKEKFTLKVEKKKLNLLYTVPLAIVTSQTLSRTLLTTREGEILFVLLLPPPASSATSTSSSKLATPAFVGFFCAIFAGKM